MIRRTIGTAGVAGALLFGGAACMAQQGRAKTYEIVGAAWFDGRTFARKQLYVVDGVFRVDRPAVIDSTIDLGQAWIVLPYGDAHAHRFDSPASIDAEVAEYLEKGIFYVLNLTGSAAGRRATSDRVNASRSVDVAYAAAITATLGHPALSAEVTANRIPWDSLRAYWPQLLASRKAMRDVYFIVDSTADLEREWPHILGNRPELIKIYLMDTERFHEKRLSTTTIGDKGLDPALVAPIVRKARGSGLRVAAHVETAADFRVAVGAGVDIVAHLPGIAPSADEPSSRYEISDADAALAARNDVTVVPTAWLAERLASPRPWVAGDVGDTAQLRRAKAIQRRGLERLARQGVRIALGADLFEDSFTELRYIERLGVFDAATLLRMWSQTTPAVVFPHRRLGRFEDGYEANLLALSCNPIEDLACTRRISFRMKHGIVMKLPPNPSGAP